MAEIIRTEPAPNELDDIAEYIALSYVSAAKKLVRAVFDKVERLTQFPEFGCIPLELLSLNYRGIIVNPCRFFYKIDADYVYIFHVMRQKRELRKYVLQG